MSRNNRLWGQRRGAADPSTLATADVVNPIESRVEPVVPRFLTDIARDEQEASGDEANEATASDSESESATGDVDREVDDLRVRLAEIQQTVDRLVDRADQPGVDGDDDADSAVAGPAGTDAEARLFTMAKRTADSVIEDARVDAAKILADAERQRIEIIARAREQAEVEFAAERDRVRRAGIVWAGKRAQTMSHLENLQTSFEMYREGLGDVDSGIAEALEALRGASAIDAMLDETDETADLDAHADTPGGDDDEFGTEEVIDLRTTSVEI